MAKRTETSAKKSAGTTKSAAASENVKATAKVAGKDTKENGASRFPAPAKKMKFQNPFTGVARENRRERFRELSATLKEQAAIEGIALSANQLLTRYYKEQCGALVLRTLEEWNAQGKSVRKGSEPLILWGQQVSVGEGDDERTYFPMKFVFDIHQVFTREEAAE